MNSNTPNKDEKNIYDNKIDELNKKIKELQRSNKEYEGNNRKIIEQFMNSKKKKI